jgi:hypothetical protein
MYSFNNLKHDILIFESNLDSDFKFEKKTKSTFKIHILNNVFL